MTNNFNVELDSALFEFISMNRVRLQLFQVYVMYEGKKIRFHMQVNDEGTFYITDKLVCPPIYHSLENTFSEAIIKLGQPAASVA